MNPSDNQFPEQQHILNIEGFLTVLTEEPSFKPRKFADSIVLVRTGGSTSAYFYEQTNQAWRRVTLT